MKKEDGIGAILIEIPPSGISQLGRGNTTAVAESEISEGNELACDFRHAARKTEMRDFETLKLEMEAEWAGKRDRDRL